PTRSLLIYLHSSAANTHLHSFPTRRSSDLSRGEPVRRLLTAGGGHRPGPSRGTQPAGPVLRRPAGEFGAGGLRPGAGQGEDRQRDRKSTRLNSSHLGISYAVFCLKKKTVREFNVLTDTYGAEYGKRAGGQINIVTASGTNQLHGSAFEYLRNSAFDARNFFDQTDG